MKLQALKGACNYFFAKKWAVFESLLSFTTFYYFFSAMIKKERQITVGLQKGGESVRGRKYSDEVKETVRAMCAANVPVKEIFEKTGVPENTIYDWKNNSFEKDDEFKKVRDKNKEKIIDESWKGVTAAIKVMNRKIERALAAEKAAEKIIKKLLDGEPMEDSELNQAKIKLELASAVSLGDITRSYGIMIDKINLLSGEPTQNLNVSGMKFEDM